VHNGHGRRRVVVTGCGVISPVGLTSESFWGSLVEGRSGIGPIESFDASGLPVRIAGEVRGFEPDEYMPHKISRRIDRYSQFAIAAATQATRAAKLPADAGPDTRLGAFVGTAGGPTRHWAATSKRLEARGPRGVSPFYFATSGNEHAVSEIALAFGAAGPTASMTTACATGATCIGEAVLQIRHGMADAMIAGGSDDTITPLDVTGAAVAGALSRRNDEPQRASRPFDADRDGFVMGAGAGVLVLEEAGRAHARGAEILAEVAGYAATTDAHHLTAPDPDGRGAIAAMRLAMADAGVTPAEIDYINAHGTGTRLNDSTETHVIEVLLGHHATEIPISSIKSMVGHLLGAAGAVEAIATIFTLNTGMVPPTINCDNPENDRLNFVPHHAQQWPVRIALSNSFGFGGHNAVLVLRRWED
jgi:3-oxoacyl-[acyl-carrier-protein] synthase II